MTIHIRKVGPDHYVVAGDRNTWTHTTPPPKLPPAARVWWKKHGVGAADGAIVATSGGRVVGFFRYWFHGRVLVAAGTWVKPEFRRRGLAYRLWGAAIRHHEPFRIEVSTVTKKGGAFVRAICLKYPQVSFALDDKVAA